MDDPEREVASILNQARLKLGLTQKGLSKRGLSCSDIGRWEGENCLPPLKRVDQVAEVYCLDREKFTRDLEMAWEKHKRLRSSLGRVRKNRQGTTKDWFAGVNVISHGHYGHAFRDE